jgi:3-phenylpropionate/cinnamic acid dioxygenase small subunit
MEAPDEGGTGNRDPAGGVIVNVPANHPASRFSYYVTDELYRELIADFAEWQSDDRAVEDAVERDVFRRLVEREARLLDRLLYEQWFELYAPECLYWVPSTPEGGDPRTEIAVMFDDRRRLEDRIFRLRTGYAWSQAPSSRTSRLVSNVEVFTCGRDDQRMVRSNFAISEFWDGEIRVLAGWAGHRFRMIDAAWKISAKQVNLLNCDQCIRNPSIVL